jgi:pyrimidine operon attenuation protein / uracil phosphoribosyltransferase
METVQSKNCILNKRAIAQKMKRLALEVVEQNLDEKELILAAINGNGEMVASNLAEELRRIHSFDIRMTTIQLNKKNPLEVSLKDSFELNNKYAMKAFLNAMPKKIQTFVLVERSHKLFPIQNDYTGLSVATTLQEHIAVETEGSEITGAWLY